MNEEKYYLVEAKCGHVGRNYYIIKTFAIQASSGKKAAKRTRQLPRVKHHVKSAIVSTKQVTKSTYLRQLQLNASDPYFCAENRQEQKRMCATLSDRIKPMHQERERVKTKRRTVRYRLRKLELQAKTYYSEQCSAFEVT